MRTRGELTHGAYIRPQVAGPGIEEELGLGLLGKRRNGPGKGLDKMSLGFLTARLISLSLPPCSSSLPALL
jgi:hypothetical protein